MEAKAVIGAHAASPSADPLFLYVAFNAAHSPLQPMPQDTAECEHIPHLWRRQFCGMVVGLDKAVQEILANRRGEYTVPTWVLTALLIAIIAAVVALIVAG